MSQMQATLILCSLPEELLGPRVLVRPFRPGDGPALWEAVEESREHLRPWMPWVDQHGCPDDSEAFARLAHARWLLREEFGFGIWQGAEGRLLGGVGLHLRDWEAPAFETGYWLRTSAEGYGYASEATRLICRLAFETFGAARLQLRCNVRNVRSAAVARRVGFVEEGVLRNESRDPQGGLRDTQVFSMLPAEYERIRTTWPGPAPEAAPERTLP